MASWYPAAGQKKKKKEKDYLRIRNPEAYKTWQVMKVPEKVDAVYSFISGLDVTNNEKGIRSAAEAAYKYLELLKVHESMKCIHSLNQKSRRDSHCCAGPNDQSRQSIDKSRRLQTLAADMLPLFQKSLLPVGL